MYRIVETRRLAPTLVRLVVEAPLIARKGQAGHFVIVRADERGERMPLTIVDARPDQGAVAIDEYLARRRGQKGSSVVVCASRF
jgi:ferredoxin--NADP+ reductase